ncbi:flavoprotein [Psychromicrobium silvestre]|uniref:Flavoprotein n=2 Tax=Psychromicrobium silvestre TaxID=1645614 RepID=A0A7Y9LSE2_9MICC|nr:flavoprotein [Psychromicrobium silvestre]
MTPEEASKEFYGLLDTIQALAPGDWKTKTFQPEATATSKAPVAGNSLAVTDPEARSVSPNDKNSAKKLKHSIHPTATPCKPSTNPPQPANSL